MMAVIDLPRSDRFGVNFKWEIPGWSVGPCVICGKLVREPGKYFVHCMDGGERICTPNEDAQCDPSADLGLQPIGSDCVRKHPELKDYIRKL